MIEHLVRAHERGDEQSENQQSQQHQQQVFEFLLAHRPLGHLQQKHQGAEADNLGLFAAHQVNQNRYGQNQRADQEKWIQKRHK